MNITYKENKKQKKKKDVFVLQSSKESTIETQANARERTQE